MKVNNFTRCILLSFVMIIISTSSSFSLSNDNDGVIKVKAIDDFANVAAKLQHDGWAQKDINIIKETLPLAEKFVADLEKSGIPKELEKRNERWNKLISNLKKSLESYKKEINSENKEQLLDAVDRFGAIYQALVAMTKPYVPEVEEFHKYMAKMFHKDYPEMNIEAMKDDIKNMMMVVNKFEKLNLPNYYKPKEKEFKSALITLKSSISDLETYMLRNDELKQDDKKFESKVEALHDNFHALEELFL